MPRPLLGSDIYPGPFMWGGKGQSHFYFCSRVGIWLAGKNGHHGKNALYNPVGTWG